MLLCASPFFVAGRAEERLTQAEPVPEAKARRRRAARFRGAGAVPWGRMGPPPARRGLRVKPRWCRAPCGRGGGEAAPLPRPLRLPRAPAEGPAPRGNGPRLHAAPRARRAPGRLRGSGCSALGSPRVCQTIPVSARKTGGGGAAPRRADLRSPGGRCPGPSGGSAAVRGERPRSGTLWV